MAISFASSRALLTVASGDGSSSLKSDEYSGWSAGYTPPVVVKWRALDVPINRGRLFALVSGTFRAGEVWFLQETADCLHYYTPTTEHEADLGLGIGDPDGCWQTHGDSNTDSTTIHGRNGWFGALIDSKGDLSTAISVV